MSPVGYLIKTESLKRRTKLINNKKWFETNDRRNLIDMHIEDWNELVLGLVLLLRNNVFTIPVALSKFIGQFYFPRELYSAAIFITAIPIIIVFIIFQNWFIKGLTTGAIKG